MKVPHRYTANAVRQQLPSWGSAHDISDIAFSNAVSHDMVNHEKKQAEGTCKWKVATNWVGGQVPEVRVKLHLRVTQFDVHFTTTVDDCALDDRGKHSLQSFPQIFN